MIKTITNTQTVERMNSRTDRRNPPGSFDPVGFTVVPPRRFEHLRVGDVFRAPSRTVTDAHASAFQTVAGSSPVGSGWFSFVYRDALGHGDLALPRIKAASNDHRPAPTISRKSRPSHMEKSVRDSCIMLQKPYRGSFISENPQKP
jgi:hypothetical protein